MNCRLNLNSKHWTIKPKTWPQTLTISTDPKLLNPDRLSLRIVLVTWPLQSIVFKWRQNSPNIDFASWSRIDTTCLNALCHCCGQKAWAASAQSFTLWQQAAIEVTRSLLPSPLVSTINCSLASQALLEVTNQDHSIGSTRLLLVRATYIWVLFFAYIPFVVNRAFNVTLTERLQ